MAIRDLVQWRVGLGKAPDSVLDTPVYVLARGDGRIFPGDGLAKHLNETPSDDIYTAGNPGAEYFETAVFYLAADSTRFFEGANLSPFDSTIRDVLRAAAWFADGIKRQRVLTPPHVKTVDVMFQVITDDQITEIVISGLFAAEILGEATPGLLPDGFAYPPPFGIDDNEAHQALLGLPSEQFARLSKAILDEVVERPTRPCTDDVAWRAAISLDNSNATLHASYALLANMVGNEFLNVDRSDSGGAFVSVTAEGHRFYESLQAIGRGGARSQRGDTSGRTP